MSNKRRLPTGRSLIVAAIVVAALAGGLRFYRLGAWSFHADEIIGFREIDLLQGAEPIDVRSQLYRLPRMVPLGYAVMAAGQAVFGRTEFGSRALMALLGTANAVVLLLGLARPLGLRSALAVGVLAAVWPDHIYYSQFSRFYIPAALFSSLCMVLGAHALERRSTGLLMLAFGAGFAALASHSVQGALIGCLILAVAAYALRGGGELPPHTRTVTVVAVALAAAVLLLYLVPLGRGWNPRTPIGPRVGARMVLALVNKVGFPIAMLAPLGAAALLRERPAQGRYWLVFGAAPLGMAAVMPLLVAYNPDYVFPASTAVVVLAGYAIGSISELLERSSSLAAGLWFIVAASLNLPGVVSYYVDGNRHDFRTTASLIERRLRPGDRIAGDDFLVLTHYSTKAGKAENINLGASMRPLLEIAKITQRPGRIWFVFPRGRAGLPEDLRAWLGQNCRHELEVGRTRLDYREWVVDVFLWDPGGEGVDNANRDGRLASPGGSNSAGR